MIDFIMRYKAFCKKRSGKLLPEEVSLILRMLPQKTVFKIEWLRLSLIKIFYVFTKDKIKGIQLYNNNPICEILIYQPFSWVGKYTFRKLKKLLINEDDYDYDYFLYGLINSLKITNNTDNFFVIWKKLAKKVYESRHNKSNTIILLINILTFQINKNDIIKIIENENKTGGQDFNNKCYEFLYYLVENYDVDQYIIKSILFITDKAQNNKFASWLSLLHIALKKSGYEIIHKVGLSIIENVVLKDYDIFYKGRGYDINNIDDIQGIIDMMIRCGSAKAYFFKEIYLEKAAKPR